MPGTYIGAHLSESGAYPAYMSSQGQKFNMIYPGLTGKLGSCSFESYTYPGYFLRHYNDELYFESKDNPTNNAGKNRKQ